MNVCPGVGPSAGFISSMTGYIDCQAQVLGSGAWSALAAPGSSLTLLLTGFLTIFIALIGYNLLLGHSMTVRSGTLAAVKIGAVFALATSWPAYRTLVYDLVTDGPSQLVAEIGPQGGVVGADGTLTQRLDDVDSAMGHLALLGAGPLPPELKDSAGNFVPPPPFGGFDAFALGGSRILFELTALAGLGIVRIVAGLMLALGPFFIAFLMFDSTRSLFEGWVRIIGGAALAGLGASIALGLELALIEPWIANVVTRRMADEALPMVPAELFVIVSLFSIIVAAVLYACARLVGAFRLAPLLKNLPVVAERTRGAAAAASAPNARRLEQVQLGAERSRAAAVANGILSMDRRELRAVSTNVPVSPTPRSSVTPMSSNDRHTPVPIPVGRSFTRRPQSRVSASAAKRDSSI